MGNIILIGMPSSGKSTAGKVLAEQLGYTFLDCDRLIESETGKTLAALIEEGGAEGFIAVEEGVCCRLFCENTVVATGGSVVYSEQTMAHFKKLGTIVYLKIGPEEVNRRISDFTARGVVMRGNITTLNELYAERIPLYEAYAEITIDCEGITPEQTAKHIIAATDKE